HSLLVPPHLQDLYEMYMRELDERKLERAVALDKVTTKQTIKEGSLPKISLPGQGRDYTQDVDSDQESVRNMLTDNRRERQQILKGVQNIVVKAARRRSKALEVDVLRLPAAPSPLDPKKQKSNFSLIEAPPRGLPLRRGRQPSPELRHATSDDNLSSSTGEGPGLHVTWTRPRNRHPASKNQTPREVDFEARRKKRRSRSFEVTGQALPQTKAITAQRFRPLDSTSDPHLHINGQPQAPMLRPQYRGVPPIAKIRPNHSTHTQAEQGSSISQGGMDMQGLSENPLVLPQQAQVQAQLAQNHMEMHNTRPHVQPQMQASAPLQGEQVPQHQEVPANSSTNSESVAEMPFAEVSSLLDPNMKGSKARK
ncbi:hypothetical protein XENOCAPTIV_028305, partial [Xenoophorus captivus]